MTAEPVLLHRGGGDVALVGYPAPISGAQTPADVLLQQFNSDLASTVTIEHWTGAR